MGFVSTPRVLRAQEPARLQACASSHQWALALALFAAAPDAHNFSAVPALKSAQETCEPRDVPPCTNSPD